MRALLSTIALVALAAAPAFAAEDGALGATSNGNFFVTAQVVGDEPATRVSSLADFDFGQIVRGDGPRRLFDTICVYHTSSTVQLTIAQTDQTNFALVGPAGALLPFDVILSDFDTTLGEQRYAQRIVESGVVANQTALDCSDGPQVLSIELSAVPEDQPFGTYGAQITVIVAVE